MRTKKPLKALSSKSLAPQSHKHALRTWLVGKHAEYQLALTLTVKQAMEVKSEAGTYYRRICKDDIKRIATHFTQKLNKQVFGVSAAKSGRSSLKYFAVIEGERSFKRLHIHMAIGGLDRHTRWNKFDELVRNAKQSVKELDIQHKLDIMDSGWLEYMSKEVETKGTDNVLWELA